MRRDDFTASPIRYLSLFSGIEAATVAWAPLGWICVGMAEIDKNPSAVLAHHYPNVPNLGDITKITEADIAALGHVDALVFGSPCQDMSIAGKRKGLLNADGTITRSGLFFTAFNIFMWAKKHCGCRFAVWENVPGAYSSNQGRDFASVVEFMAGLDDVAVPDNGWGTEGCALGDNGLLEWACLDAQWFGVAQRRRRVFAVLDTGNWASRQPILLERQSLRGDTAPRRETGQDVAGTITSSLGRRGGQPDCGSTPGLLQPVVLPGARAGGAELGIDRSPTLTCNHEAPIVAGDLTPIAFDARQDCVSSTEVFGALGSSSPQAQAIAFSCKDHGAEAAVELAPTMRAMNSVNRNQNAGGQLAVAFAQNSRDEVRLINGDGQIAGALSAESGMKQACYVAVCVTGEVTHTLKAEGFDASEDGTGRGQPIIAVGDAYSTKLHNTSSNQAGKIYREYTVSLDANSPPPALLTEMAVRRLTPIECERLQGFPDGYTAIPIKKYARKTVTKLRPEQMWRRIDGAWWLMSADGPRYKTLGNSMAVPVMAWIGRQIQLAMETI